MTSKFYVSIDTETGGLDHNEHSLLSVAFVPFTLDGETYKPLEFLIRPFCDTYKVDPRALAVNHIDLVDHYKNSMVIGDVVDLSLQWFNTLPKSPKPKLIGWNIAFDLNFLTETLFDKEDLNTYFDYHTVDVSVLYYALQITGKIPEGKCSLSAARSHFGLTSDKEHTALDDAVATAAIFMKCLELL